MFIYKFMGEIVDTFSGEIAEEEEGTYDPHHHRGVKKPTTVTSDCIDTTKSHRYGDTMIHLLKGSIGAGILAMPDAVGRVGIFAGIIGMLLIGAIATYCIQLLIAAQYELCKRERCGYMVYPKSMRKAIQGGPPFMRCIASVVGYFVDVVLVVWQLGLCCVYCVFVAENIKQVLDFYSVEFSVRLHLLYMLIPLILTNIVKDLKLLTPLSTVSNIVTIFGLILVFFYLIEDDVQLDDQKFQIKGLLEIPVFIGITLFALEAVGVVLALEYNMENPKEFVGLFGLFNIGMVVILALYMLVGVFGYLKYGNEVQASITLNLPREQKKAQAAKLIFALAIFLTFPLQNFVAYSILWRRIKKRTKPSRHVTFDYIIRFAIIIVPWILAVAVPQLGPFISLFGAFCLSLLALVFPGLMDACLWYPDKYGFLHYKLLRDILIMLIGIGCLIAGCYTSVLEIIHKE